MDEALTKFLHQKNSNALKLASTLNEHQHHVIDTFGGLTNMIELCLTNPNVTAHQVDSFIQLLEISMQPGTIDEDDMHQNTNTDTNGKTDIINKTDKTLTNTKGKVDIDINVNDTTSNNCKQEYQGQEQTVDTSMQFDNCRLTINCTPTENMLFALLNRSNSCVNKNDGKNCCSFEFLSLYNHIASNKLLATVCSLSFVFDVASILMSIVLPSSFLFVHIICRILMSLLIILYCIAIILISNITIIHLISNTFHFWFQIYNFLICIVSLWVIWIHVDEYAGIFITQRQVPLQVLNQMANAAMFAVFFILDAVPFSINAKRVVTILFVCFQTMSLIGIYFIFQDYEWNPFGMQFTKISFKSIYLSSMTNLLIFVSKRILSDVTRYFYNHIYHRSRKLSDHDITRGGGDNYNMSQNYHDQYQRCATLYKRPHLKWNKINTENDMADALGI